MNQQIEIKGNQISVTLHTLNSFSDGFYIMYNPALNVCGYGRTIEMAKESFEINLQLFFEDMIEAGALHRTLIEYGWQAHNHSFSRGQLVDDFIKSLPMNMISSDQYQGALSVA